MTVVVFHLIDPDGWETARSVGHVTPPGLAREGFVHCSTREQLEGTIARHFEGVDDLLLLRLDEAALGGALRWDEVRPGERYPHVYRRIALTEVLEVVPWHRRDGDVIG